MKSPRGPQEKARGSYYTERRVAEALCRWALRTPGERVLDPAFGGGVFLEAAGKRAASLADGHEIEIHGVEIDPDAHGRFVERHGVGRHTVERAGVPPDGAEPHRGDAGSSRLLRADFFALSPSDLPPLDAVVGNPPFIRFQRFKGRARALAAARAEEAGVELGPLAGSWVAFVAHATSFLDEGGRLALVVPAELGHAPYARPLLARLASGFGRTTIVAFRRSLFPHLDQETVLLLADGYGRGPGAFALRELAGAEDLDKPLTENPAVSIDAPSLITGRTSLALELLDGPARCLYRRLEQCGQAIRLEAVARVESGYVTGANREFQLTPRAAHAQGIPQGALVPAVFRSRALGGLRFRQEEWEAAGESGTAGYLVQAHGFESHPAVSLLLERLTAAGVPSRYKARNRTPWYRVPRVNSAPLILPAMSGNGSRLVLNGCSVAASNTFHLVTPLEDALPGDIGAEWLVAAWLTSLTRLSVELEGHALGGGMLKLDPGEARQVLLPPPAPLPSGWLEHLDELVRSGQGEAARLEADRLFLAQGMGLSEVELELLRAAASKIAARRQRRQA
jgi:adenine-specific DNA-methyltransferase